MLTVAAPSGEKYDNNYRNERKEEHCRMSDPLYNLASPLYDRNWYQGIFGLGQLSSGHCYTFNPDNYSSSGTQGQLYAFLGKTVGGEL